MTTPKIIILLNVRSRGGMARQREAEIKAALAHHRLAATIWRVEGRLDQALDEARAAGATTLVAAGGDGTIRTVGAAAARWGLTLGVIPTGTFNHFAKGLGLPRTIADAVGVIAAGHVRRVDYGSVNDHFFINSAGMGIHPLFVRRRLAYERQIGKWLAIPVAIAQAFWHFSPWRLILELPDGRHELTTPFVFIGNNDYQVEQLGLKSRRYIDDGQLFIYSLECQTRRHLLWLFVRSMFGGVRGEDYFRFFQASTCRIQAPGPVHITLDGELTLLRTPLVFKVKHAGLTVLAPAS